MASTKPRLNLYLSQEVYDLLGRLAAVRGIKRPAVITDLLEVFVPQLTQIADLMEAAQRAPEEAREKFAAVLAKATEELEPMASELIDASDRLQLNLEDAIRQAVERTKTEVEHRDAA